MRILLAVIATLLILVAPAGARQDALRADAERMDRKVQAILARAVAPAPPAKPVTTSFTEGELNAYLRLQAQEDLPVGIKHTTVAFLEGGRLDTRALVDLDAVRVSEKRGWLDPLAYVTGILEVRTIGMLKGSNGKGVYAFESATVDGVPVPRALLQELFSFYTRSPETPKGIQLDTPFELPARIREVELRRGMATVIQ